MHVKCEVWIMYTGCGGSHGDHMKAMDTWRHNNHRWVHGPEDGEREGVERDLAGARARGLAADAQLHIQKSVDRQLLHESTTEDDLLGNDKMIRGA